jgi:hypothetical protein
MPLVAEKNQGNKKRAPQAELEIGTYPCRIVQVVDLGVCFRERFDTSANKYVVDEDKSPQRKIMVTYEFVTEFIKDEDGKDDESKPRWLSEKFFLYPLDVDLAVSTKRSGAIDPTGSFSGDWSKYVGLPCMVTIGHKPNGKAKIIQVSPPVKGLKFEELKNGSKVFLLDESPEENMEIFLSLPEWVQEEVRKCIDFDSTRFGIFLNSGGETEATTEEEQPTEENTEVEQEEEDW